MRFFFTLKMLLFSIATIVAQDKTIHQSELPLDIQNYVNKHFPDSKILKVEEDKDYSSVSYEIQLQNNVELEFEGTSIKEIDSKTKLPDSVIPQEIRNYVSAKYPNNYIINWEIDDHGEKQQIELNNELELEFNKNNEFIRIDD